MEYLTLALGARIMLGVRVTCESRWPQICQELDEVRKENRVLVQCVRSDLVFTQGLWGFFHLFARKWSTAV